MKQKSQTIKFIYLSYQPIIIILNDIILDEF